MPVATQAFPIPGGLAVTAPADLKLLTPFVLAEQGDWFESEIHFIRRLLQPGMGVVDVGANFGLYTLTAARAVGPTGWVAAFEPASLPRTCLAESLEANALPHVTLHGQALSNQVGVAHLTLAANSELNSLGRSDTAGETVPVTTLDAAAATWNRPVHFLKLDAEGEELRILEGAQRFLAAHDPLVMFELRHGPTVNVGLVAAFRQLGFATYRHLPGLNVLVPLPADTRADPFLLNVFACRPATAARLAQAGLLLTEPAPPVPPASHTTDAIAEWNRARPWARALWPAGLPAGNDADSTSYQAAMVDILHSEDPAHPAALRWAFATRALADLRAALDRRGSPPRLFTAARVALALGERAFALEFIQKMGTAISPADMQGEPFLPPQSCFDDLDPAGDLPAAIAAMRDESLLTHSAFSVYFSHKSALPVLLRLARNPLRSPSATRRLRAARHLLPVGPV